MKNLTLVIPAKNERDSLPKVLDEIKDYDCKIIVVLESSDIETIDAIKNYDCKIIYQSDKGYGNALIDGFKNTFQESSNLLQESVGKLCPCRLFRLNSDE